MLNIEQLEMRAADKRDPKHPNKRGVPVFVVMAQLTAEHVLNPIEWKAFPPNMKAEFERQIEKELKDKLHDHVYGELFNPLMEAKTSLMRLYMPGCPGFAEIEQALKMLNFIFELLKKPTAPTERKPKILGPNGNGQARS
jgi:hypothetical protein